MNSPAFPRSNLARRAACGARRCSALWLTLVLATAALAGCETDDPDSYEKVNTLLADGDYFMGIQLTVGSVKLRMKVTLEAEGELGKGGTLQKIALRGLDLTGSDADWQSDVLATATGVKVGADNAFDFSFGEVTVPAKSSPAGEVKAVLKIKGTIAADGTFCGELEGSVTVGDPIDLKGSTFKAVPFKDRKPDFEVGCVSQAAKVFKPIATCPALTAGTNKMVSAEMERTFEVRLPAGATPTGALPLVVLFHGMGGSANGILKDSGYAELLKSQQFILVAPDSAREGGKKKYDLDWNFAGTFFDMDNPDLVLFDDLLTCVSKSWNVNAKRVYVTGMSGGGLMSTFAAAHRSTRIAAAAPMSGGYLHKWPTLENKMPFLVTWGGPEDKAASQDFHAFALALLDSLTTAGHAPIIQCQHALSHKWPPEMTPAVHAFLNSFTLQGKENPYAAGSKLPGVFPSYCTL